MKKIILNILFIFSTSIYVNAQDRFDQYLNWLTSDHKYDSITSQQKGSHTFSEEPDCPDYYNWALVWEDNFNGTSLNEFYWTKANGAPCENTQIYYSQNNVIVENGILKLYEQNEYIPSAPVTLCDSPYTSTDHAFSYTSSEIITKQKYLYGKFEIMLKLPTGQGHKPSFWLSEGESDGPNYREIDVFEFWNQYDFLGFFQGWKTNKVDHMSVYNTKLSKNKHYEWESEIDLSEDFHKYTLEWDSFTIKWYLDDTLRQTHYRYYEYAIDIGGEIYPFNATLCNEITTSRSYYSQDIFPTQPMKVKITTRVDNENPNHLPTLPSAMEVDWIKIYERINPEENVNYCFFNVGDNTSDYSVFTGNQITIGGNNCDAVINGYSEGESLTLVACNRIDLNPGFKVETGGRFSANIVSCSSNKSNISDYPLKTDIEISNQPIQTKDSINLFNIYPNPNNGTFKISFNSTISEFNGIAILNSMGSIVYQTNEIQNNEIIIDISNNPNGIYLLTFMLNNQAYAHKLIKQ